MSRQSKKLYLPVANEMFSLEPSKAQLQQLRIIQTAISSFAYKGIEKTTYTNLAKECKISRPLIHHYFPTLDDLFLMAAKYARITLLECAREGILNHPDDELLQLKWYINGCFRWIELFPDQANFWLLYYYQAGLKGKAYKENTELVKAGHKRIEGILLMGKNKEVFKFEDAKATAKAIQILITGGFVSVLTEQDYLSLSNVGDLIFDHTKKLLS